MIAAYARDASGRPVIGLNGAIPWHLPEDFQWFRMHTMHKTLVMGRKTYETIKGGRLPNRRIAVLSTNPHYKIHVEPKDAFLVNDYLSLVQEYLADNARLVVCGGAEIYKQFLPWCSSVLLTELDIVVQGDTFLPFTYETLQNNHAFSLVMLDKNLQGTSKAQPSTEWTYRLLTRKVYEDAGYP